MRVAVIGGGPSGLVTLKYLTEAHKYLGCEPIGARLFEYQPQVGGTFAARVYEEAELVSSRQLTTFSDFRVPNEPDFLSTQRYVAYLEDYCTRFALWKKIHLNTRVLSVERQPAGHRIVYQGNGGGKNAEQGAAAGAVNGHGEKGEEDAPILTWECDAVAVCSGLHVEPNLPPIPGLENVPRVLHSSGFKARKQFHASRTVMVVGSGETGADVAYLAVTTPNVERVLFCHRDGFHFAPKRNPGPVILPTLREPDPREPGIPIDVSRANMFDTAYVHPILRRNDGLLWEYYNLYIKSLLFIASGTTLGMDQWAGGISKERHHPSKIFFNKSMKLCPYISQPYRPQTPGPKLWLYALRSALVQTPIPDTQGRHVDVAPWPKSVDATGAVEFVNNGRPEYERLRGQRIRPDTIVLCTGYRQSFPFLKTNATAATESADGEKDAGARPYPTPDEADVRRIWSRDDPTIGFIGFVRPSLGAIPPLSELQAQLWITNLVAPHKIPRALRPEDETHYRLRPSPNARITYGVDHESYAYQLALDMDSAPGLGDILGRCSWSRMAHSCRLLLVWIFGAHINTKFRVRGPWAWDGAAEMLASDEMWQTITRRPILFGHFAVSILPMTIFGPINLVCWLCATLEKMLLGLVAVLMPPLGGVGGGKGGRDVA